VSGAPFIRCDLSADVDTTPEIVRRKVRLTMTVRREGPQWLSPWEHTEIVCVADERQGDRYTPPTVFPPTQSGPFTLDEWRAVNVAIEGAFAEWEGLYAPAPVWTFHDEPIAFAYVDELPGAGYAVAAAKRWAASAPRPADLRYGHPLFRGGK
jgi:hypothetical protein